MCVLSSVARYYRGTPECLHLVISTARTPQRANCRIRSAKKRTSWIIHTDLPKQTGVVRTELLRSLLARGSRAIRSCGRFGCPFACCSRQSRGLAPGIHLPSHGAAFYFPTWIFRCPDGCMIWQCIHSPQLRHTYSFCILMTRARRLFARSSSSYSGRAS